MKLAVFGTNDIGLTASAIFASHGHDVVCTDEDRNKIGALHSGEIPVDEEGLLGMLTEAQKAGLLSFSVNRLTAASEADILLFTEPIPVDEQENPDLTCFFRFIRKIALTIKKHKTFIIKSNVPPGTASKVEDILIEQDVSDRSFDVVSNPDFIRKGSAVKDFMYPSQIIIGTSSLRACRAMQTFYEPISSSLQYMDHSSAELMRYAYHTYQSLQTSCLTMIAGAAEKYGGDVELIQRALPKTPQFTEHSLHPGSSFLGTDTLVELASFRSMIKESSSANRMFKALEEIDQYQPERLIQKLKDFLGTLQGAKIAIFTSSAVKALPTLPPYKFVIKKLKEEGAFVQRFDTEKTRAKQENERDTIYESVQGCDALLLMSERVSVKQLNWGKIIKGLNLPLIVDGHNLYTLDEMRIIANTYDLIYCSIGRPNIYKGLGSISVQSIQ
ncbi:nucleotide sugar dehydrogenase [Guptibacillus spartinae]|uniref:nucleotide sugar dehydrogenase n=1 Tax=Guptibacillus spartinae TaxID=3025679 RepID=UPI0023630BFB|nr:nucleotide sugar dehydrogenase [Pseudalkalibacillus spartinae]